MGAKAGERSRAAEAINERGGRVVSYYAPGNFFVVDTPSRAPEWIRSLDNDPRVRYAELDYIVSADTHTDGASPNDPRWPDLWGMQKIKAEEAWHVSTGSKSIVVGIIDSGVDYTHEDIGAGQMWVNPEEAAGASGVDDDGNGFVDDLYGADCRNNDGNPIDDNNHGTHVAGTTGAATNNAKGVAGANWNVSIMALKFLSSSGSGSTSDAIECLDYAIAEGAHLTSNSWGGGGYSQALWDAIKRAENDNQVFVAAAGNDSANTDASPHYPSTYDHDNIVSVAATDSSDKLASFSNYGASTVDLGAPGVGIWSTIRNNGYDDYNGTSMATPHVAGVAALVVAAHGGATPSSYPYTKVLDRIYGSLDPVSALSGKTVTGGRLNAARAVETDSTAPGSTTLAAGSAARTSISLSWTAPYEDGAIGGAASSYDLSYAPAGTTNWSSAPAPKPATPGTGQLTTVSGLRPGTNYEFRLTAKDNAANTSSETVAASTAAGDVVFSDDTESGSSSWTGDPPWAVTSERPHSPGKSWSDSPNGSHANGKDVSVRSASSFSLAGVTNPKLTFWHRYNLEPNYDYAYVYISTDGGSSWTQLARYNGHLDQYTPVEIGLGSYAGASNVKLRFRLTSDGSIVYNGWFFDDVIVSGDTSGLAITELSASPNLFSPNGDTKKDTSTISFKVNKAANWTAQISDATATIVCTASGSASSAGTQSFVWDGTNGSNCNGGTPVADGSYTVGVTATSGAENANASTGVTVDTTPPTLSNISASNITGTSADITWDTNEASDSLVEYRAASATTYNTASNASFVTSHKVSLTGLQAGTTYYYRVRSADAAANSSTSAEQSFSTASIQTKSYAPDSISIAKGSSLGDPISNLATDDGNYYRVASQKQGRNNVVDWYGEATLDVSGVTKLTLTYDGSYTTTVPQKLYVFNFSTGAWQEISSANVSTTDQTFTWSTTNPAPYISGNKVRMRVTASIRGSYTCKGDLMRFTVEY